MIAEDLLVKFVPDGALEEDIFNQTIASLINKVQASVTTEGHGKVRVFGEMVSQLRGNDPKATARLEELWNKVIQQHAVSLLCTYALEGDGDRDRIPDELVGLHSHSIERDSGHLERTIFP